ncbi:hypothetical protein QQY24_24360 [Streptomyces sp. TG1A-8]|uniref:hypothetical protein n=1 Tax=Streptomyces sp. TG1A-8 TaxID=3051385 RepID=UPI00265C0346|nr:hypothetical protein [Streptomyces sp. TG1A-8]MDO0928395.1 hypothetical protein [Streptomyces sp. TG1A-8]
MHAYDTPPHRPAFSSVPPARSAQEAPGGPSATPIYDRLYAEWVKTFRTLPGDRSGEEELGFNTFGHAPHGTGSYRANVYGAYSAGAQSARHGGGQQQQPPQWQRVGALGRQQDTGMHHVPAALPPGPRRGV